MLILVIRTDKPEAELYLYRDNKNIAQKTWQAHRELSVTIHTQIDGLLKNQSKALKDIQGLVVFKGPGSFTGLRIGLSVANALAYSLGIPIVAANGIDWIEQGLKKLAAGSSEKIVLPKYGASPHVTLLKK